MSKGRTGVRSESIDDDAGTEIETEVEARPAEESVRDSTLRAFNDLKSGKVTEEGDSGDDDAGSDAASVGEDSDDEGETKSQTIDLLPTDRAPEPPALKKARGRVKEVEGETIKDPLPDDLDPELQPPERLLKNEKAKLIFNNLPKTLKREYHRMVKDVEAGGSRVTSEAQKHIQEVRSIKEAVEPFAGQWAELGFTVPQGILSLARSQQKLTDPKTAVQTYVELGRDLGITPEIVQQHLSGKPPAAAVSDEIERHPKFVAMQKRVDALSSAVEQTSNTTVVQPIVQQLEAVRHQVDAAGDFLYPELHDDDYLNSLKTRVLELKKNSPQTPIGDCLLQANAERKQKLGFGKLPNSSKTRIPASPNQNRISNAGVSVRGNTTGQGMRGSGELEPPPEVLKNPRATTAWVHEQLRRGTIS